MPKTTNSQFPEEREQIIMDFLQKHGKIRVEDVTDMLGISPSTARIQLQKMHDKGLLQRTHGGAVLIGNAVPKKGSHDFEHISNKDKKFQIAAAAAKTIQSGDYIALGCGTTTFLLATLLHDKTGVTVVTDSIPIAAELMHDENITLYVCGGWVMERNGACRGTTAENFFRELEVDKSYCGADSVNIETGTSSVDFDPRTESAVCRAGKECYILADSTKFSIRPYIDKLLKTDEIDCIISDDALSREYIQAFEDAGVRVIIGSDKIRR